MLIDNTINYDHQYLFKINKEGDSFYYFFDYDERNFDINMEFQHYHSFYEICILLDQSAVHIIEGEVYDLECGDIVLLRPHLLHKTQYPEGNPSKRIIINFAFSTDVKGIMDGYHHLFELFLNPVPIYRFRGIEKKTIYKSLNQVLDYTKLSTPMRNLLIHNQFVSFLSQIAMAKKKNIYKRQVKLSSISEKIHNIAAYIHANYSDPLSLNLLAKQFYISEYYLSHQFKNIIGFTITDYIQITRVKTVENLLTTTQMDITDIALYSGFNSFSQFNRVFRKHIGMSPSQYRKTQATVT